MQDLLAFQAIWRCGISKKKKKGEKVREGPWGDHLEHSLA